MNESNKTFSKFNYLKMLERETLIGDYIVDNIDNILLPKIGNIQTSSPFLYEEIFTKFFDKIIVDLYLSSVVNKNEICLINSVFYTDYFITIDFVDLVYKIPRHFSDALTLCRNMHNIRFFVIPIKLIFSYKKAHSNVILIDTLKHRTEFFEPHGDRFQGDIPFDIENHIYTLIERLFPQQEGYDNINDYDFVNVQNKCLLGLQGLQSISDPKSGHCLAWSLLFIHIKLINLHLDTDFIIDYFTKKFNPFELDTYIKLYIGMLETTPYNNYKTIPNFKYRLDLSPEELDSIKDKIINLTSTYMSNQSNPSISEQKIDEIYEELVSYHKTPNFDKLFFDTINENISSKTSPLSPLRKKSKLNIYDSSSSSSLNDIFQDIPDIPGIQNNQIQNNQIFNNQISLDELFKDTPTDIELSDNFFKDIPINTELQEDIQTTEALDSDTATSVSDDSFLSSSDNIDEDSDDEDIDNLFHTYNDLNI